MSSQPTTMAGPSTHPSGAASEEHGGNRLGWFLCWAVVFADLGTSVYYTPGILYQQVGSLAGLFVSMTLVVFLLLTLKYAEVSVRFPEGGGVVTVAARGLNPWAGAVGGMFILVDYFLTSAISSLSGLQYFTDIVPGIGPYVLPLTVLVVVALGVLNWWGIKESAMVSAVIAVAALLSDAVILVMVLVHIPLPQILGLFHKMFHGQAMGPGLLLTGYAGAFLAFSGLESISQLSPVMRAPRHKTVRAALAFVVITVGISSPLLTIFSTTLLNVTPTDQAKLISQLGGAYGGDALRVATAISASALLVFASNTAIIGAYHVFLALSRMQFFPKVIEKRNKFRDTPHVAIAIATGIPIAVLIAVQGQINILGDMYAFGLLGAFSLTCIALDAMRIRERRAGVTFSAAAEDEAHALVAKAHGIMAEGEAPEGYEEWVRRARQRALSDEEFEELIQTLAREHRAARDQRDPFRVLFHRVWPHAKYYLGFATTFLVTIAWCTNLYSKPLATAFGGTLTLVGVGISVINFKHQTSIGQKPIFPSRQLYRVPGSMLVLLPTGNAENEMVVRAAVASDHAGLPLVFLGLGTPYAPQTRTLMEMTDAYFHDEEMKHLFAMADAACRAEHIPAHFFYRLKRPGLVNIALGAIQPAEVVAAPEVGHKFALAPGSLRVRKQNFHGMDVVHYVRRHVGETPEREEAPETTPDRTERPMGPTGATGPASPANATSPTTAIAEAAPAATTGVAPEGATPAAPGESSARFKKVLRSNTYGGRGRPFASAPTAETSPSEVNQSNEEGEPGVPAEDMLAREANMSAGDGDARLPDAPPTATPTAPDDASADGTPRNVDGASSDGRPEHNDRGRQSGPGAARRRARPR